VARICHPVPRGYIPVQNADASCPNALLHKLSPPLPSCCWTLTLIQSTVKKSDETHEFCKSSVGLWCTATDTRSVQTVRRPVYHQSVDSSMLA
jgi:hypothetical protein